MTKDLEARIEDLIVKAVQSTKRENSALVADINEKIKSIQSDNKSTNNKLEGIQTHLRKQDDDYTQTRDDIADIMTELKRIKFDTDPLVQGNRTFATVIHFILKMSGILAALAIIYNFFVKR